ncbi:hypothetical protein E2986_13455 [Frieseomelitta varia]|uniref:Uncharacterized protein n=1 Tax=Frieseomelitta varia TaxID=561572 RepID=A0A833S2I2_9HYME|nr:hypothetical protein E2986_13455 [Frieseomelitta varia]
MKRIYNYSSLHCLRYLYLISMDVCRIEFKKLYEALWYNTHPKTQALYALALRRSLTPPRLTAGGLIELNMESFSEVTELLDAMWKDWATDRAKDEFDIMHRTILHDSYFRRDFTQERIAGHRVRFSSLSHDRRSEVSYVDQRPRGVHVLCNVARVLWLRHELHAHCATRVWIASGGWVKKNTNINWIGKSSKLLIHDRFKLSYIMKLN